MSNGDFILYTVYSDDGYENIEVGKFTVEATAETIAGQYPNTTIETEVVPLPDLIIDIMNGYVVSVRTTDGHDVEEVTVRDRDVQEFLADGEDHNGPYKEYTV